MPYLIFGFPAPARGVVGLVVGHLARTGAASSDEIAMAEQSQASVPLLLRNDSTAEAGSAVTALDEEELPARRRRPCRRRSGSSIRPARTCLVMLRLREDESDRR